MQDAPGALSCWKQDCYKRRDNSIQHLRCSGVHLLDVSVISRLVLFVLVTRLCWRYDQFETSGSTLTQMSPGVLASLQSSKRVSQHSVKYTVCVVRWYVPPCWHWCTHALVVTKVDYCNSVLSGISGQLLQRLHSVFNAAARLVFSARKSRARNSTPPWTTAAESSGENSVPVMCSRVSLP